MMCNVEVYTQSERFKYGWVAGFYDALFDDGLRYLNEIKRYGARSSDDETFLAGYRAGRQARLGLSTPLPEHGVPLNPAA